MTKQFLFLVGLTVLGTAGPFLLSPVVGLGVYYFLAVLRPNFWWGWALPDPDMGWSRYVALGTLLATALWRAGVYVPFRVGRTPWYGEPTYTRSHYLFLLFVGWISLTYPTAQNTDRAGLYFEEYVKIFMMFICGTLILRRVQDLWLIYFVVLAAVVYIGYEGNMYYFLNNRFNIFQRYEAAGQDNNWVGLTLAMVVPMCYFAWEAVRHWVRWSFLLMIPVVMHSIMLSYSRGAMLSLCVAAAIIWVRARNKAFVTMVYGLLFVVVLVLAGKEIQDRFFSISKSETDESAQSRWTTWKIAVRMANEKPVFGFGIRNSNLFTRSYGADMEGRSIHSQYLQTAADSGWVGLGLYLLVIGSVLLALRDVRRILHQWNDPETARVKSLAAGIECSLLVFLIGAVFLSMEHFELPYILMLLAVQLHAIARAIQARTAPALRPAAQAVFPARVAS